VLGRGESTRRRALPLPADAVVGRREPLGDVGGRVTGAVVDHEPFPARVRLTEKAVERLAHGLLGVVGSDDHRDSGPDIGPGVSRRRRDARVTFQWGERIMARFLGFPWRGGRLVDLRALVCPACKGPLEVAAQDIHCGACRSRYPQTSADYVDLLPEGLVELDHDWSQRQAEMEEWYRQLIADPHRAVGCPTRTTKHLPSCSVIFAAAFSMWEAASG
jgi:hypothetical protein